MNKKSSFKSVECADAMALAVKYAGSIVALTKMFDVYYGTIHNALNGKSIRHDTAALLLDFLKKELADHDKNKRILRSEIDKLKQSI